MKDRPGKVTAGVVRVLECFLDKFGAHVFGDSKADEHPGIAVDYRSEIHIRPVRDRQIGDIANEHPICSWCREVSLDQVGEQANTTRCGPRLVVVTLRFLV